ncbi:MAG TPA: Ig-like domain-containing protein [Acidimicrobiales bacterium]|nr:Ig-like domain-containing protein [Acidimicrobiales bacterium]
MPAPDPRATPPLDTPPAHPSQLDRRTLAFVGALGLALPAAAYFWFIHRYGVNMIWNDQWTDLALIKHAHTGSLSFSMLWAQHTANRILFPNLIVLALAYTAHYNSVVEEYVSGAMLVAATGLIIVAHRRRSPTTPWLYYCPVALLMFTFVGGNTIYGGGNTLWGFQMAWYLVLLALAATLFLLDRPRLTGLVLAGAMATAVVGSFSALQGLLIWPAGLVLLYLRRRSRFHVMVWIASAVIVGAVYFFHYSSQAGASKPSYVLTDPISAAKFFVFSIGDNIIGQQIVNVPRSTSDADLIVGGIILALAVWVAISGIRRQATDASPLGVALISFGLLFTALITASRAWEGFWQTGRYAMFELLIWVGCYLALLGRSDLSPGKALGRGPSSSKATAGPSAPPPRPWPGLVNVAAWPILIGLIVVQVVLGTHYGVTYANSWRQRQLGAADVTSNINTVSDSFLQIEVGQYPPALIRQMAAFAKSQHLNLFDTALATQDARQGLFPSLQSTVVRPADGARVSGVTLLAASVNDSAKVTRLQFRITGGSVRNDVIGTGRPTPYGWSLSWDTTTVANGVYTLQSVLEPTGGPQAASVPTYVVVRNRMRKPSSP